VERGGALRGAIGYLYGGRYQIEAPLGAGGMGDVYRATDLQTRRAVAVKVLRSHLDGPALARFQREAHVVKSLAHPNTVRLFDFGADEAGTPFIVYELVEGRTLAGILQEEGPLGVDRAVRILAQVLRSLAEAHQRGIVHRDIKPANVMVLQFAGDPDVVKVLDFGVAKSADAPGTGLTGTGDVVGTPRFMSPEQFRGEAVGPASDLYAVGLLACEMLNGPSASAAPIDLLRAHLYPEPLQLPPRVAASPIAPVIRRLLERQPTMRHASAEEVLADLERCAGPTAAAPRPAPPTRSGRASLLGAAVAAALALVATVGFTVWYLTPGPTKKKPKRTADTSQSAAPSADVTELAPPDPACAANGCLRSILHIGDYDKASLERALSPGARIDNGYSVYTIAFATSGAEARATVTVPFGVPAPAGGWHIVANAHGTTGIDDPCAVAGTIAGAGLSGTFGARGLIGVAVDYPGLGTPGTHPYLVADSEGWAVLDALRAAKRFARSKGIAISSRLAVAGLSQGGHAALAAAARHKAYAPELDLRGFAAAAPASVFEEHWRAGVAHDGQHIAVYAMLVYAWAQHYGHRGPDLWAAGLSPHVERIMRESCIYSSTGAPLLADRVPRSPAQVFSAPLLTAFKSGQWGPFSVIGDGFRKNRIGPYAQTAPLKIYQGDKDDIVPEWATRQLVDALRAGGVQVDYETVPGGNHFNVAFGAVAYPELRTDASIAWLKSRLGP
jgi:serine/threonine protein kinase/dienelactone hydrolase